MVSEINGNCLLECGLIVGVWRLLSEGYKNNTGLKFSADCYCPSESIRLKCELFVAHNLWVCGGCSPIGIKTTAVSSFLQTVVVSWRVGE